MTHTAICSTRRVTDFTCFTRWYALKLVKNHRALMLDIDLGTGEYPDESSEFPAFAAMKQGLTSQKCGTKMKDRYFCVVLLVRQAYWEALPGKDDDVADHPFESHNPVYQIMSVDANGASWKEQACPESAGRSRFRDHQRRGGASQFDHN